MSRNYTTARILDNSGRTIITESMLDKDDLRVDISTLPLGAYLIEFTDGKENRIVDKFVKGK